MWLIGLAVILACLTLAPLAAKAQPGRVHLIGFLGNSTAALEAHLVGPFCESIDEMKALLGSPAPPRDGTQRPAPAAPPPRYSWLPQGDTAPARAFLTRR
jgi:hypothetical protein